MVTAIEHAQWYEGLRQDGHFPDAERLYFGHETCEHLLPSPAVALSFLDRLGQGSGTKVSLVTPFLSPQGLKKTLALVELMRERLGELEVICSDWGLVHHLARHRLAEPVVGRLLVAQITDPCIGRFVDQHPSSQAARQVRHLDGTDCRLQAKLASDPLRSHYRSCWTDKPEALALLSHCGVRRCEISNVLQGIELTSQSGLRYSLHLPEVLVTLMRRCPGHGEDFARRAPCPCEGGDAGSTVRWLHAALPVELYRRDNALYYHWPTCPANLCDLPVDRIVGKYSTDS